MSVVRLASGMEALLICLSLAVGAIKRGLLRAPRLQAIDGQAIGVQLVVQAATLRALPIVIDNERVLPVDVGMVSLTRLLKVGHFS